jgi:hypothetical protein
VLGITPQSISVRGTATDNIPTGLGGVKASELRPGPGGRAS